MSNEKTNCAGKELEPYFETLSKAIDLIREVYEKAGFIFPDNGVVLDIPYPELNAPKAQFQQCIMQRHKIKSQKGSTVIFTTWDCEKDKPLPEGDTARVSCQYNGETYSEGAIIPLGDGKGQRCENNGSSNTEGVWVVRNLQNI